MGAASATLTAFKVTVAGAGATLAGQQRVGVHAEAHGAAGLTPFGSCGEEDFVQAFGFRLLFDQLAAGDNHHLHRGADVVSAKDSGGVAEVFESSVGATADEDAIHFEFGDRRAALDIHVLQRALDAKALDLVAAFFRSGDEAADGRAHAGRGTPGDPGLNAGGIHLDDAIEPGAGVAG